MKKFIPKLKTYVWISLACVAAFCICLGLFVNVMNTVGSLNAADVWRGDNPMNFTQIAVFFPESNKVGEEDLQTFFKTAEEKLSEAAVEKEEGKELFAYTYSSFGKLTASGEKGNHTASVTGVGGDFFFFHPLELVSGNYISDRDYMKDGVILDRELAWALFGATDVEGMEIRINNLPFRVAGVVEREEDFASKEAYTDGPGLFMDYSAFYKLTEGKISCFEIVMPNVISGFAKNIVTDAFSSHNAEIIENSRRYNIAEIMRLAGQFDERAVQSGGFIYPYWENAVRITETNLSILFVLMVIFAIFPLITLIVVVSRFLSGKIRYIKETVPAKIEARIEEKKEENYRKTGGR